MDSPVSKAYPSDLYHGGLVRHRQRAIEPLEVIQTRDEEARLQQYHDKQAFETEKGIWD